MRIEKQEEERLWTNSAGVMDQIIRKRELALILGDDSGHLMGDVWGRPGLSLRDRELVTLGVIIGLARPMGLKTHLRDFAANVGITREELQEVIIQAVTMQVGRQRTTQFFNSMRS